MPLRTRLSNTGLKLKIPVRSSSNGRNDASPYGPSPRHSASPHRRQREEVFPLPVSEPRDHVSTFDASVDTRPVWSVTSHKLKTVTCEQSGFREIPITRDLSSQHPTCDSPVSHDRHDTTVQYQDIESPDLAECRLSPDDDIQDRSSYQACRQRAFQRAEILRDWMHNLPLIPRTTHSANPFFGARKKDFNYQPYKYLSSPLPQCDQSPDSPARYIMLTKMNCNISVAPK